MNAAMTEVSIAPQPRPSVKDRAGWFPRKPVTRQYPMSVLVMKPMFSDFFHSVKGKREFVIARRCVNFIRFKVFAVGLAVSWVNKSLSDTGVQGRRQVVFTEMVMVRPERPLYWWYSLLSNKTTQQIRRSSSRLLLSCIAYHFCNSSSQGAGERVR